LSATQSYHGEGLFIYREQREMIDPEISSNPVGLIRMKKKDGSFLFSEAESERFIEVILDRAKEVWAREKVPEGSKAAGRGTAFGKPTGRGKLFWVDSE
jgi:hypothetical protein